MYLTNDGASDQTARKIGLAFLILVQIQIQIGSDLNIFRPASMSNVFGFGLDQDKYQTPRPSQQPAQNKQILTAYIWTRNISDLQHITYLKYLILVYVGSGSVVYVERTESTNFTYTVM
jgi:hypothetical protein